MKVRQWSFFMPPLEHRSIRRLEDLYRCRFTPAGRALIWGGGAALVLRLGALSPPLYATLGIFVSQMVFSLAFGWFFRPRVRMERRLPPPPTAGEVWHYDVHVINLSKRPIRDLSVQERYLPAKLRPTEPTQVIPLLKAGEQITIRLGLHCISRGVYHLSDLQVSSRFPVGLVQLGPVHKIMDRFCVYPAFERLRDFDVPIGANHQSKGISGTSHMGRSMEFAGLRDWREGDRPHSVHWPAYARSGRLVVREHERDHVTRCALILDIEVSRYADLVVFERALSVAASLADRLAEREQIIELFGAGNSVCRFQIDHAQRNIEHILELLASLEPGASLDIATLSASITPVSRRLSAVIVIVTTWDEGHATLISALRASGVTIQVICLRPNVELQGLTPHEVISL